MNATYYSEEPFGEGSISEDDRLYGEKMIDKEVEESAYSGSFPIERTSYLKEKSSMNERSDLYLTLQYINQELLAMNVPCPIRLSTSIEDLEDSQRVNSLEFHEDLSSRLRRTMQECDYLSEKIENLKDKLDSSERKEAALYSRNLALNSSVNKAEITSRKATTELAGVRSASESNKSQFVHEVKRKEQEMMKIKERMQKIIVDKHKASKVKVELVKNSQGLLSPYTRSDELKATFGMKSSKADLTELSNLESDFDPSKDSALDKFKSIIKKVKDLIEDFNSNAFEEERNSLIEENKRNETSLKDQIKNLNDSVSELEKNLDSKEEEISKVRLENDSVHEINESAKKENIKLQQEIGNCGQIIDDKDRIIEQLKSKLGEQQHTILKVMQAISPLLSSGNSLEESVEEIINQKNQLEIDKIQLKNDKSQFMNAVLEMGKERTEVEKLRQKLKMHQINSNTAEFLSTLPPTPSWLKNVDLSLPTPVIHKNLQNLMENTPISSMHTLRNRAKNSPTPGSTEYINNLAGQTSDNRTNGSYLRSSELSNNEANSFKNEFIGNNSCELYNCDHNNRVGCKKSSRSFSDQEINGNEFSAREYEIYTKERTRDTSTDNSKISAKSYDDINGFANKDYERNEYSYRNDNNHRKTFISNPSSSETMNNLDHNSLHKYVLKDDDMMERDQQDYTKEMRGSGNFEADNGNMLDPLEGEINPFIDKETVKLRNPARKPLSPEVIKSGFRSSQNETRFEENSSNSSENRFKRGENGSVPSMGKVQSLNSSAAATPPLSLLRNRPSLLSTRNQNTPKIPFSTQKLQSSVVTGTPKTISKPKHKLCSRPGCAAHHIHYHEDGTAKEVVVHELKPPVPKFQKTPR
ncbi:hypothetical protein AYI68_g2385 [Smittium mucronatum]|uniref:Uncharacterized protein n=1 Tax=Smittium mucronatum TaxID=133383 RepID=A0A1R0H2T9_9FUNG|nr:hypothetical protein AYI68_g2385 [Smittium mucronatum]